ncbi:MAG TPA: IclR family transcriptional regulator [Burkholderiaceae bacterium]|nr:IclR family transcriptional regulator [Burkholderiaceae bacterium]
MDDESPLRTVKSAERVLDVFELFARRRRHMSHAEIADALSIPKSSLSQLLATLVGRGYLELAADRRNYGLGPSLLALARQRALLADLVSAARPVLKRLTRACGESSALNLLSADEAEVVCSELGPHRLVSHMREGDRAPLYATSSGKVLLAFMAESDRSAYLAGLRFDRITPKTLSSRQALKSQLDEIRRSGIGYSYEEFTPGIVGIGVPLFDADDAVVGAINVAMPAVRYGESRRSAIVAHLIDAAKLLMKEAVQHV